MQKKGEKVTDQMLQIEFLKVGKLFEIFVQLVSRVRISEL